MGEYRKFVFTFFITSFFLINVIVEPSLLSWCLYIYLVRCGVCSYWVLLLASVKMDRSVVIFTRYVRNGRDSIMYTFSERDETRSYLTVKYSSRRIGTRLLSPSSWFRRTQHGVRVMQFRYMRFVCFCSAYNGNDGYYYVIFL